MDIPVETPNNNNNNIKESIENIWEQTQINLCLLVAMLKDKERISTSESPIIGETISKIEGAQLPEPLEKIKCNSDMIAPILDKIKKTMKVINKDLTDEQIIDCLIVSNSSLIKKYINLYLDISDDGKEKFIKISENIDNLLNNMPDLNKEEEQGQGQSVNNFESAELVLGLVSGIFTTAQILGGKKSKKNKGRKSKKSKKSRKRKSRRYRKLTK